MKILNPQIQHQFAVSILFLIASQGGRKVVSSGLGDGDDDDDDGSDTEEEDDVEVADAQYGNYTAVKISSEI